MRKLKIPSSDKGKNLENDYLKRLLIKKNKELIC